MAEKQTNSDSTADLRSMVGDLISKVDAQTKKIAEQQAEIDRLSDPYRQRVLQQHQTAQQMRERTMRNLREQASTRNVGEHVWKLKIHKHKHPRYIFLDREDVVAARGEITRLHGHQYDSRKMSLEYVCPAKDFAKHHDYAEYRSLLPSYCTPVAA